MMITMQPEYSYVQIEPGTSSWQSRKTLFLGIGLFVAIIIGLVLILSSGQKSISNQAQHLSLRLNNLQTMLSDTNTTRNIKNQDLSNLVTSFSLSLTTDTNDITSLLGKDLPQKPSDAIVAAEADTTTAKTIEDAYLENKLDTVYADVLVKKIDSLRALITEMYGLSKDAKLKQSLQDLDTHLSNTRKQITAIRL